MFGQLIPQGGGDPIPLQKEKLLVGRRSSCDITLDYPNVSAHHCELEMVNGYWHVRDLNSSNGTKVNGERVLDRFLQPGDTLSIAKHHYEVNYAPDPSLPAPEERDPFAIGLLEKAGLVHASDRRPSARPVSGPLPPASRPLPPKNESDISSEDSRVMKWLSEE